MNTENTQTPVEAMEPAVFFFQTDEDISSPQELLSPEVEQPSEEPAEEKQLPN